MKPSDSRKGGVKLRSLRRILEKHSCVEETCTASSLSTILHSKHHVRSLRSRSLLINQPNDLPIDLTRRLVMLSSAARLIAKVRSFQLCRRLPKPLQVLDLLVPFSSTLVLFLG
jgi:hypothetical protein